jgi:hypothetical protein
MNRNHITLGEEVRTKFQIIVEVEGPPCFEALSEVCDDSRFFVLSYITELLVRVLRQSRSSAATAAMM